MSRRKDELRALLAGDPTPAPAPNPTSASASVVAGQPAEALPEAGAEPVEPAKAESGGAGEPTVAQPALGRERATSGAVKAMGLALGHLRSGAEEARTLRESMARGDRVVEIDPELIEPAFVSDRLSRAGDGDESFDALKASIEAGGQEVPVLVRPHPEPAKAAEGRYQAAYGHRRIAATRALGRKVRAVVRVLTDEELVLAQGKENSERRDLSFIERALFCRALLERGFERRTVQAALSLHKADMTRLLQVAESIPLFMAKAIGPAPRAGRTRWMEMAELLRTEAGTVKANQEIRQERFRTASSDARFTMLLDRLARRGAAFREAPREVVAPGGARIASLRQSAKTSVIEISERAFADFVAAELPGLHAAFAASRKRDDAA